jgi:hypothetical protein
VLRRRPVEVTAFPEADGEARMSMRKTGFGTSLEATAEGTKPENFFLGGAEQ